MVQCRKVMVFCLLALLGCRHKSHNIVGTWDIKGGPGPVTFSFTSDGNFKTEATIPVKK